MKPFDDIRMNYLRGKGSYSRPGQLAKKKKKEENMKEEHGAGDFGTDELTNRYKRETPGQQTEAKATYCGRCGTTHVKPSEGGTCPALKNEEVDSTTSAARKPVKVKINGKEVVRMEPVKNDVQTERTLTKAELKKREEVAKAIERDNPNMPMDKKMAIATATAKKVSEMNFHQLRAQLDELSRETLASYASKASDASKHRGMPTKKVDNRYSGVAKASKKLDQMNNEEVEVQEELTPQQKAARLALIKKSAKKFGLDRASQAKRDAQRAIKKDKYLTRDMEEATNPLTPQHVKQGIGIARDKRYAGGNMTGAVKAMDKVHPKLSQHPVVQKELQKQNEQYQAEAVGTAAKYADKSGFMGGKYSSHDRMMTMKNFSSIRDKRAKQRDDEHKKQDPKMQKMGYAKHMVDTQKAKKKAQARGVDPSKTARSDYQNKNGSTPNRKLPESRLQSLLDLRSMNESSNDVREIGKQLQSYAKKNGGIDRKHMEDMAKQMIQTGKLPDKKHMNDMDTDPRELVYGIIFNVMGEKGLKPYGIRMK